MPSTFSTSLRLELVGSGEQSGTWNYYPSCYTTRHAITLGQLNK